MTSVILTTELDAVNLMLDAIGAQSVNSTADTSADVAKAVQRLNQTNREIQSQGWHFNSDTRYALARTVAGEYVVPTNVLRIDASDDFPAEDITIRTGKLWDKNRNTFVFDRDITFDIIWLFPFEELPEAARNYIAIKAARRFQQKAVGSDTLASFDERDEMEALTILRDLEADNGDYNILNGNWSVARVLHRTGYGDLI